MSPEQPDFFELNDFSRHPLFQEVRPHIVSEFKKWHSQNPKVWELFRGFAYQLWNSGRRRYSARSIIERIRWDTAVKTQGSDFKIGDHCIPCYARLMMISDDRFKDFFTRRHKDVA